jgi:hypothetical protein
LLAVAEARGNVRFTFREMTLRLRSILFYGGLLLFCASTSLAEGEYQQTRDSKTFVWNGTPKPGETAIWDGDRDKEHYASGFGDLTWYTANGKVYARYYGNMVHGKFEGAVNVHTNGRTGHAYFVDGGRLTEWARGPAPSKMALPDEVIVQKRKAEAEREAEREAAATKRSEARAASAEAEKKRKTAKEAAENAQRSASTIQRPISEPSQPSSSSSAVVEKQSEAPTAPTIAEKKSEPTPAENELPRSTPPVAKSDSEGSVFEPTPLPPKSETMSEPPPASPMEESRAVEPEKIEAPTSTPAIAELSPSSSGGNQPSAAKSDGDVSLNALVGPPSSLRTTAGASPPKTESETSTSRDDAPLTEAEVIRLADTEARVQGYQLNNYQRPKVDHSTVKAKWSLFYGLKEGGHAGEDGGPFTVTVEDKTKKVEVRR